MGNSTEDNKPEGETAENRIRDLVRGIRGADREAEASAEAYVQSLAAPPGSLGKLTDAAVQLAGITGKVKNTVGRKRIIVMCADNGVVAEGVSSAPPIVTFSQAANMTRHSTGMSALAAHFGCEVEVVDVGIATPYREDLPNTEKILNRRIRRGTGNIFREPAMTRREAAEAVLVGFERAEQAAGDGVDVLGVGEMGIGNTTTSAAVLAALTGLPVEAVTGRGGGLTDSAFEKKKSVITRVLRLHGLIRAAEDSAAEDIVPEKRDSSLSGRGLLRRGLSQRARASDGVSDIIDVLSKAGGLDIAAMCGVYLGAALYRIPVVIDGFISIVAALCAQRICGACREFMFPSHVSEEAGYLYAARELELEPWLHLNLRLGEGSGCVLAFQILEAACALMNEMATFEDAGIDDGYLTEIREREKTWQKQL